MDSLFLGILPLLVVVLGVLAIVFVFVFAWPKRKVRKVQHIKNRLELEHKYQTSAIQLLGALGLLAGSYFAYNQLQDNRKYSEKTNQLALEQQLFDGYSRAIDQLGKGGNDRKQSVETRIGGILALERVAMLSREGTQEGQLSFDYSAHVVKVLSAYLRFRSEGSFPKQSKPKEGEECHFPFDNQVALDVLADLSVNVPVNLGGANLHCANLIGQDLRQVDLRSAQLTGADLSGAVLTKVRLGATNFHRANLSGTVLDSCKSFRQTDFSKATLDGLEAKRAFLTRGNFSESEMFKANFRNAWLKGANFSKATIHESIFVNADVSGADFTDVWISNTDMRGCNLEKASQLRGALFVDVTGISEQQAVEMTRKGATIE